MTDPKPDPLFDALREQLADYGQAPPAHLWAGIRQQLPPPVALPQRRRRRGLSVALLALLVAVIGVVSWQAWVLSPLRQRPLAGRPSPRSPAGAAAAGATLPATAEAATTSVAATAPAPVAAAVVASTAATAAGAPAAAGPPTATSAAAAENPPVTTASGAAAASPSATVTAASSGMIAGTAPHSAHAGRTHATHFGTARPTSRPALAAGRTAATAIPPTEAAGARVRHTARAAASARAAKTRTLATGAAVATRETRAGAGRSPAGSRRFATPVSAALSLAATAATPAAAARQSLAAMRQPPAGPGKASFENGQATATGKSALHSDAGLTAPSQTTIAAARALAYDQLALRQPTLLALAPSPLPAPPTQPVKRSLPASRPAVRWVTQTLFGPALTGVRRGTPTPAAGNVPASFTTLVKDEEQATRSGNLQFSLRRNLATHWSLSAGLGVAEYATESTLSQRYFSALPSSLDPSAIRRDSFEVVSKYRKSYQFATLPVRLGYAWQPSLRWQLGLLAGIDATYLFHSTEIKSVPLSVGTTASTSAANQRWGLGSSLGLEARYHFSPHCELLAQPTFTYLLTSLNSERTGEAPRHPWGAALLLGVAYELR